MRKAFVNSDEKPDVQRVNAREVFNYDQMYGHSNAVAGMKEAHQFKMGKYQFKLDECCHSETTSSVVLTHYKQW